MGFTDPENRKVVSRIVMMLSFGIAAAYGVLMFMPTGWHIKSTQIWTFYVGLFTVSVRMDTLGGGLFKHLTKGLFSAVQGKDKGNKGWQMFLNALGGCARDDPECKGGPNDQTIQSLRDQFCNIELVVPGLLRNCHTWSYLLYGSWILAIGLILTIACLLTGCVVLAAGEGKCIRRTVLGMYCSAAFFNVSGFVGYAFLSMYLKDWLREIYGSHSQLTFSVSSVACAGLTVVVCVLPLMVFACGMKPAYEEDEYWQEQEPLLDEYGNPVPVDQYGNPLPSAPDPYVQQNQGYVPPQQW